MSLASSPRARAPRRLRRSGLLAGVVVVLALAMPSVAHAATHSPTGTPPGKAWVRVGHFVPGMGATRIVLTPLDGAGAPTPIANHSTYGHVSAYQKLAPGSYTVVVTMSSASADSAPVLSRALQIGAGQARTLAVLGTATAPRLALLTDDLTPPSAGTARVRLLSASDQADSVTVTAVDGPTIAQDAVQGQATAYATVPAGTWTLNLQSDMATASLQSVPIASGSVYTVVVLDAGQNTVRLDVVTDAAGAVMTPKGGAETGLGGMAPADVSAEASAAGDGPAWALAGVALLLALALAGRARRRVARPRR